MKRRIAHAAPIIALALAFAVAPVALAGKGGGGGKPSGGSGSSSLSLVMAADPNSDGLPNWGDTVTFNVSTTAPYPTVDANCYQSGTSVYTHSAGFYPTYPWPQSQNFVLKSYVWTGGAADCTATLSSMSSNGRSTTLATLSFHVNS